MANVYFKKGTLAALNTLKNDVEVNKTKSYVNGAFYLTEDTDRLYFAQSESKLVYLNHGVLVTDTLPTTGMQIGDIYYIPSSNILAIYEGGTDGSHGAWTLINPDTYISSATMTASVVSDKAKILTSLTQEGRGNAPISAGVNIVGAGSVSVTAVNNEIVISSTDTNTLYDLKVAAGTTANTAIIRLTDNTNNDDIIIEGKNGVGISSNTATNKIEITSPVSITAILNIYKSNGEFETNITLANNLGFITSASSTNVIPRIVYGQNGSSSAVFASGTATLNVYSTSEIDALIETKIKDFDAMVFKGFVDSESSNTKLSANNSLAGDTYKATGTFKIGNNIAVEGTRDVEIGDLIIANGTDDDITWTVVPSGDDQELSASLDTSNNSIQLTDSVSGNSILAGIKLISGTGISVSSTTSGSVLNVTVAHSNPTSTTSSLSVPSSSSATWGTTNLSIPVLSGITKDQFGHIVSVTGTNYTLVHGKTDVGSIAFNSTSANNVYNAKYSYVISTKVDGTEINSKSVDHSYSSKTLTFSNSGTATPVLNIDLEWGTF